MIWLHSNKDLENFVAYLNSIDPNIKWTHEVEKNSIISFLDIDVLVHREKDGEFTTSVYRKSSHSDRYLHFSSDHPLQQKISGLQSLKYRAFAYCSNAQLLTAELNHFNFFFK